MAGPWLIAVMGPTASGKTPFAEAIADHLNAQLINADAFQVYRGMDIGTAKPVHKDRYKLLDLKAPNEGFGVGEWLQLAHRELHSAFAKGQSVVVVGGTGLYVRALFEEYSDLAESPDPRVRQELMQRESLYGLESLATELKQLAPEVAERVDLLNPVRVRRSLERLATSRRVKLPPLPPFHRTKFVVQHNSHDLSEKITYRINAMMQNGWLEEVESLRDSGYGPGDPGFRALGYSPLWQHLAGEKALAEALDDVVRDTRRYAKRQRSWLRSEPKTVPIEGLTLEDRLSDTVMRLTM